VIAGAETLQTYSKVINDPIVTWSRQLGNSHFRPILLPSFYHYLPVVFASLLLYAFFGKYKVTSLHLIQGSTTMMP
jgi:hypothetical protein